MAKLQETDPQWGWRGVRKFGMTSMPAPQSEGRQRSSLADPNHCGSVSYSLTIQMYDAHLSTINIHLDSIFHHGQTTSRLKSHGGILLRGFSRAACWLFRTQIRQRSARASRLRKDGLQSRPRARGKAISVFGVTAANAVLTPGI